MEVTSMYYLLAPCYLFVNLLTQPEVKAGMYQGGKLLQVWLWELMKTTNRLAAKFSILHLESVTFKMFFFTVTVWIVLVFCVELCRLFLYMIVATFMQIYMNCKSRIWFVICKAFTRLVSYTRHEIGSDNVCVTKCTNICSFYHCF